MKQEIKDAMFYLGHLSNPKKDKKIISKYLQSPIIQDISYDGKGTYIIDSEKYGRFIFTLASYYFRKNKIINNYLKNEVLPQECHNHAYFLSNLFVNAYSVTSLCPYFFLGEKYYHSYTHDLDENIIIDLCYNVIIDKDLYYQIFDPEEISVILNKKVREEYQTVEEKTKTAENWPYLLSVALYKQYLKSINYKGSLEEAPILKKKIF